LNNLIIDINAGKFDDLNQDKLKEKLRDAMNDYMEQLKAFELTIELIRLKVLRGELSLKKTEP